MSSGNPHPVDPESQRLAEDAVRTKNWKRWGPYLAERQWGTVREDYSADGDCWGYFPHDHARSRVYRWGEDGLLGICDRECRLCFALALWNGKDPILKERLFGLTGPEGNHGEDVKELYYYLDSTPTHSYMKALYKYPQAVFPYHELVEVNRKRRRKDREYEITDTGIFDDNRYFDVFAEYAKAGPNDLLIRITVHNRGPDPAPLHLLPTLWFRNSWAWGCTHEGCETKPRLERLASQRAVLCDHATLGRFRFEYEPLHPDHPPDLLFTENESNLKRLFDAENYYSFVKDAFHRYVIGSRYHSVNPKGVGTKMAVYEGVEIPAGGKIVWRARLYAENEKPSQSFGSAFDRVFDERVREADQFWAHRLPKEVRDEPRAVARQAGAGLLWSKQFYHYVIRDWLDGDPAQPKPPASRKSGRNSDWGHLFNRDVLSMPDKWEYSWYAAWDLAFHMIPFASIDPEFAKQQLLLMMREWYMHPNGQLPAYEFCFSDVNPPVHAWACWRVYKLTGARGHRDRLFLQRAFHKLMLNFNWWVNRKDVAGRHLFSGGFLGLDNIGLFDRSKPLPNGHRLEQADGTAWMAFFCGTMLSIALELAREDPAYEDVASKFFEHFVAIVDAMNTLGGPGLWNEEDGFYYDHIHAEGKTIPLRVRSMVGIIPLFACEVLEHDTIRKLPGFWKRMQWFLTHRADLARHIAYMEQRDCQGCDRHLLAIPSRARLERVLGRLLDENEFLSPHGLRSLSKMYQKHPFTFRTNGGKEYSVSYVPGESTIDMFGGNSNWRGPVWMPLNFLLIEALERYHHFYGDTLQVEYPTGSGRKTNLAEIARDLALRNVRLFLPDPTGQRPAHGDDRRYADDPYFRNLILFHEYFDGDTGRGCGASHQTGWTALVAKLITTCAGKEMERPRPQLLGQPQPLAAPASVAR